MKFLLKGWGNIVRYTIIHLMPSKAPHRHAHTRGRITFEFVATGQCCLLGHRSTHWEGNIGRCPGMDRSEWNRTDDKYSNRHRSRERGDLLSETCQTQKYSAQTSSLPVCMQNGRRSTATRMMQARPCLPAACCLFACSSWPPGTNTHVQILQGTAHLLLSMYTYQLIYYAHASSLMLAIAIPNYYNNPISICFNI